MDTAGRNAIERWQRFTLADAALTIASLAPGLASARFLMPDRPEVGIPWGMLLGGILLGPIALASQRLRGRKRRHTVGESLWLVAAGLLIGGVALVAILVVIGLLIPPLAWVLAILLGLLWLFAVCAVSFLSLVRVADRLFRVHRAEANPPWTDLVGAFVALLTGPWFVWSLLLPGYL